MIGSDSLDMGDPGGIWDQDTHMLAKVPKALGSTHAQSPSRADQPLGEGTPTEPGVDGALNAGGVV
jgi:hypothetical protein